MPTEPPPERAPVSKAVHGPRRWIYRGVGLVALALAAIGVVLPLLPTVPFLVVAAWAFARGAPHWADRLRAHPGFGPLIIAWEERQVIPVFGKIAATFGMAGGWAWVTFRYQSVWLSGGLAVLFLAVLCWILTRPST